MIENAVRQSNASLVVVDSLMGAMEEENKPVAKRLPKLLGQLAERNDCGVITTHFRRKLGKGEKRKRLTVHDIRGFGGIAGFFSSVIAVDTPDPGDDTLRRVYIIKGERALEFGFRVFQSGAVWRFEWADPAEAPVRKLKKDMASDLLDRMCKNGRRLVRDIEAAGKGHEPSI